MDVLVPVKNNIIIVYCPHKNCEGWIEIDINNLIGNKKVESICNKRGLQHKVIVELNKVIGESGNIRMVKLYVEEG